MESREYVLLLFHQGAQPARLQLRASRLDEIERAAQQKLGLGAPVSLYVVGGDRGQGTERVADLEQLQRHDLAPGLEGQVRAKVHVSPRHAGPAGPLGGGEPSSDDEEPGEPGSRAAARGSRALLGGAGYTELRQGDGPSGGAGAGWRGGGGLLTLLNALDLLGGAVCLLFAAALLASGVAPLALPLALAGGLVVMPASTSLCGNGDGTRRYLPAIAMGLELAIGESAPFARPAGSSEIAVGDRHELRGVPRRHHRRAGG